LSEDIKQSNEKLAAAYDESGKICRTHVGGQALLEGIMMRGRYNWALAVRKPNGTIHVEEHDLVSGRDKNTWMYKPVVRGCTSLVESLALGYKALEIAANHAFDEEELEELALDLPTPPAKYLDVEIALAVIEQWAAENKNPSLRPPSRSLELAGKIPGQAQNDGEGQAQSEDAVALVAAAADVQEPEAIIAAAALEPALEAIEAVAEEEVKKSEAAMPKAVMTGAMIVGMLLGVTIFIVVPAILTNLIVGDYADDTLLWNLVDGVIRVIIFIGYIFLIGRMSDIRRMFGYHGAEHRTIHCYERGQDLTVANAQSYPSLHVRCGTAFMLMTMIIAIFVFTIVPINLLIDGLGIQNDILRLIIVIISRILLLPLIAGLAYEFTVKWAGNRPDNPLVKVILWPGLQLQRLTTNPPDDGMVECAIAAMNAVLAREVLEAQKISGVVKSAEPELALKEAPEQEAQKVAT